MWPHYEHASVKTGLHEAVNIRRSLFYQTGPKREPHESWYCSSENPRTQTMSLSETGIFSRHYRVVVAPCTGRVGSSHRANESIDFATSIADAKRPSIAILLSQNVGDECRAVHEWFVLPGWPMRFCSGALHNMFFFHLCCSFCMCLVLEPISRPISRWHCFSLARGFCFSLRCSKGPLRAAVKLAFKVPTVPIYACPLTPSEGRHSL